MYAGWGKSEMSTSSVILTTAAGAATALYFIIANKQKNGNSNTTSSSSSSSSSSTETAKTKEQAAKASFRVHRANLMSISGRGKKNRKKDPASKRGARQGRSHTHHDGQHHPVQDSILYNQSSWFWRLVSSLKQTFSQLVSSIISFGLVQSQNDLPSIQITSTQNSFQPSIQNTSTANPKKNSMEQYYDDTIIVGLDCEMVGGGKGGWKSLLARCSVVTLDHIPNNERSGKENTDPNYNAASSNSTATTAQSSSSSSSSQKGLTSLDQNLVVLYDKYVIPKGKITDYRTEWSGITKDTYKQQSSGSESPIPIVSFQTCQNEISQLFSSIEGKKVVVVGHALENDFDALEIEHPQSLVRDTAFYPPYMRRVRKKMYPRKLSVLSSEELEIEIQQKSPTMPTLEAEDPTNTTGGSSIKNHSTIGHSSVEDAAAALRLYWHKSGHWEKFLGNPLLKTQQPSQSWSPLTMFLDGCNLPMGMRGVNFKELLGNNDYDSTTNTDEDNEIPAKAFRLTSRKRDGNHPSNISTIDWIPAFQSALLPQSAPKFDSISVMFDGAKFSNIDNGNGKSSNGDGSLETRVFHLESSNPTSGQGPIRIEITENGDSADDVLFHRCTTVDGSSASNADSDSTREIISLDNAIDILSSQDDAETDVLPHYVVIRRKAGGIKTHRKLFDKLHLRRPDEGALCLSALTPGLRKDSWKIARELKQAKSGVEKVIECEMRRRDELRFVVVTDDVYLTDRLVKGGVLVLSFNQLTKMF